MRCSADCALDELWQLIDELGAGHREVAASDTGGSQQVRLGMLAVGEDGESAIAGSSCQLDDFPPGDSFGLEVEN